MSKEEILKIQTCVLKVNIHCDGCENKVKKILQKIEGVYKISINSEQGKVSVSGNVDPTTLIKKLGKSGKHAELWGSTPKSNPNQLNNTNNSNSNFKVDGGKGASNKNQKGNNANNNNNNQPKGGGAQNLQQLQQVQKMKGFQDLKLPQFKGLKLPFAKDQNKKVKFEDDDDMSDDEYDDDEFDDDDFDDDDYLDDDVDDAPHHAVKGKPVMGNAQMLPNMMGMGSVINGQAKGGNGKKGGGGNVPAKGNDGKNGKKGGGGNVAQNQGGGKNGGGATQNKNGNNNNNNNNGNAGKKAGGGMNDGVQGMANMSNGYHHGIGNKMGQMGPMGNFPMGQIPAVQGLPAPAMAGGGGGYYGGADPYQAAMMMSQQRAQGNERFQPMMYARPPPAVNYMPPYYPYPPPADPFTHAFSDENTASCSVM